MRSLRRRATCASPARSALPRRVYFLLAMCLFPEVGYLLVWQKLIASLTDLPVVTHTAKALRDLRRRVGGAPMRRLFEVLSGPLAQPTTPGARFGAGSPGHGGYPQLELMTLVETGTRALIGAIFGPTSEGESGYARRLLHLLTPDMLVLWDKGFDGNAFLTQVSATGAQVLGRLRPRPLRLLHRPARRPRPGDSPRRRPRQRHRPGRNHRTPCSRPQPHHHQPRHHPPATPIHPARRLPRRATHARGRPPQTTTGPGLPPSRPQPPLEGLRHRPPPRRCHQEHHLSAAVALGRRPAHLQDRAGYPPCRTAILCALASSAKALTTWPWR
ncbi:hypothetical protein FXF51_53540 [Nonomuraea sp. PA05]|uniref:transposase domain-containing protein n=1 Tax=Nonomuraea sp. PA05 TaxID=2604466 RepID=UPI0011D68D9F|nr:hypothetical protein FXF51_53540 [Nonomuraea sp. PA05]